MAQFMLLVYAKEEMWARMEQSERGQLVCEYKSFAEGITTSGNMLAGSPFEPTMTATTVRMKGGKGVKTAGPFETTQEQLGGYFLIEVKDMDEATAIAGRVPSLRLGTSMDVRPVRQV